VTPEGRVVRAYSNIFYVDTGEEVLECRPRGRLRYQAEKVMTGDFVRVSSAGPGLGAIEEILPRRNSLSRPPVANVDQVVVVFSFYAPRIDLHLVDRFLLLAAAAELPVVLCLNKADLASDAEVAEIQTVYNGAGYRTATVSVRSGLGLEGLRELLAERLSVLAGPSGVGKSSLLNALDPSLNLKTGDVSRKVHRGTHTTRNVSLIPSGRGGMVADTPGFTHLELDGVKPGDVAWHFPEIAALGGDCRFRGCVHRAEPGCRVKAAVEEQSVDSGRYERYLSLLKEAEDTYRPW
jgi:ribosome biogenesis GTPase